MENDNVQMWKELDIDLEPHDTLLNALGPIYREIYLSQVNRPEGMGFFDFVVGDIHGISNCLDYREFGTRTGWFKRQGT